MKKELIDILTSYLFGWKTLRDCTEWIASINWDNLELDSDILELIGHVDVILTEVNEGLRPQSEFSDLANEIVSTKTRTYIITQMASNILGYSTSDTIIYSPELNAIVA